MKICLQTKTNFRELQPGSLFEFAGSVWMKTVENSLTNAVHLENGHTEFFFDHAEISALEGTLTVKNKT